MNDGFPMFITGLSGQITSRINRIPGVSAKLPSSYFRTSTGLRYNGKGGAGEQVTLPCGINVVPGNLTSMKYNLCAFQGPVVTAGNGKLLADEYWYGSFPNTFGDFRGYGRTDVTMTLRREFPIYEQYKFSIAAEAFNLMNHAEYSSIPGTGIGGTNVSSTIPTNFTTANPIGYGTGTFGTYGMGTYDPRQIQLEGRITF